MNGSRIVEEKLTDGSKVFSLHVPSNDGPTVVFACATERHADILNTALNGVIDVSIRDTAA